MWLWKPEFEWINFKIEKFQSRYFPTFAVVTEVARLAILPITVESPVAKTAPMPEPSIMLLAKNIRFSVSRGFWFVNVEDLKVTFINERSTCQIFLVPWLGLCFASDGAIIHFESVTLQQTQVSRDTVPTLDENYITNDQLRGRNINFFSTPKVWKSWYQYLSQVPFVEFTNHFVPDDQGRSWG